MARVDVSQRALIEGRFPPVSVLSGRPADRTIRQEMVWYPWWPFVAVVVPVVGILIALVLRYAFRWQLVAILPVLGDEYERTARDERRRDRAVRGVWVLGVLGFFAAVSVQQVVSGAWLLLWLAILLTWATVWARIERGTVWARPFGPPGTVELRDVSPEFAAAVLDDALH